MVFSLWCQQCSKYLRGEKKNIRRIKLHYPSYQPCLSAWDIELSQVQMLSKPPNQVLERTAKQEPLTLTHLLQVIRFKKLEIDRKYRNTNLKKKYSLPGTFSDKCATLQYETF